jgi:hypothetical protein
VGPALGTAVDSGSDIVAATTASEGGGDLLQRGASAPAVAQHRNTAQQEQEWRSNRGMMSIVLCVSGDIVHT